MDGILGFGLPKAGQEGRELPTPLLFAMTDQENKMSNARDLTRKFSFFSTDTDGMTRFDATSLVEPSIFSHTLPSVTFLSRSTRKNDPQMQSISV